MAAVALAGAIERFDANARLAQTIAAQARRAFLAA
jgi:hypothetical protein